MTNEVIWIILASVSTTMKNYFEVDYTAINWMGMMGSMFAPSVVLAVHVLNRGCACAQSSYYSWCFE